MGWDGWDRRQYRFKSFFSLAKLENWIGIPVLYLLFQRRATTNSCDQKPQLQIPSMLIFHLKKYAG